MANTNMDGAASTQVEVDIQILEISRAYQTVDYASTDATMIDGKYRMKIRFKENVNADFTTTYIDVEYPVNIGSNLGEVISFLGIDKGGSLPGSSTLSGKMRYMIDQIYGGGPLVTNIELSTATMKAILSKNYGISINRDIAQLGDTGYVAKYDIKPKFKSSDPWVKGTCTYVADGDTIKITVEEVNNMPQIIVGKSVSVRFIGVLCPETKKTEGDWASRNNTWATDHGLEVPNEENKIMDDICTLADEGKEFMIKLLLNKKVIIDPEIGNSIDIYGRLLGCIYTDEILGYAGEGGAELVYNANKSIIANDSKVFAGRFGLAEPTYKYSTDKFGTINSKFDLQTWWSLVPNYESKLKELRNKEIAKAYGSGKESFLNKYNMRSGPLGVDKRQEIVYNEEVIDLWDNDKLNNYNHVPADSQYEDYENMVVDDRSLLDKEMGIDPYGEFHFRIGDCTFLVPPLSIRLDTLSSNSRIQTLRSKSSMQVKSGHANTSITIDLFFPNIEAINGYRQQGPNGATYFRNGLRPLIAQFKKAPFLPIENELVNKRFGIYSVAMKDLEINTIPGFPGCVQARLTLLEFDHTTYMASEEDFAATFCWPLYRWYYQKSMQPQIDKNRTYLKEITKLDNSIVFKIPDEAVLQVRQQAIYNLIEKLSPQIFKESNSKLGTMTGEMLRESREVEIAKKQYNGFKAALLKFPRREYPKLYNSNDIFDVSALSKTTSDILKYADALKQIISLTYYAGGDISGNTQMYFVMNTVDKVLELAEIIGPTFNVSRLDIIVRDIVPIPYAKYIGSYERPPDLSNITSQIKQYLNSSLIFSQDGIFIIRMVSSNSQKVTGRLNPSSEYYAISPTDDVMTSLLLEVGENTSLAFTKYEAEFEELNFKAHMSEADIGEVDFPIDDIYIQSMTAAIHNTYAPLQLSSRETPTFQHMGGSDITLDMVIKTRDREAVGRFRELMTTAQRLANDYRIAITSGIVSIDTAIMSVLGVRSILIERLSVETSKEDKESFNITISLVAFDKTQRIKEDLDVNRAFGAIGEDIEGAFYEYSKIRRNETGFEYALIDFTLKDLEVYPDLELPTFKELNIDLPSLKIIYPNKTPFVKYPNPDNAKFVDPDFYIRCEHTYRDYILAVLEDGEVPTYFKDRLGFEGFDIGPTGEQQRMGGMSSPNVTFSEETQKWIDDNLSTVYSGDKKDTSKSIGWSSISDINGISKNEYLPKTTTAYEAKDIRRSSATLDPGPIPPEIKPLITKEALSIPPTPDEIIRWGYIDTSLGGDIYAKAQDIISKAGNPTEYAFVDYLNYLVSDVYCSDLPSEREKIKAGEEDLDTYTYGEKRVSAPKITQEKIVNILKALYEQESGWKQFKSDKSILYNVNPDGTVDVGIGQINNIHSGVFRTVDMARQAAWFWQYNLSLAVEVFGRNYNFCIDNGAMNPDAPVNPLDWAIVSYYNGAEKGLRTFSNPQETEYYNMIMKRFQNKYGAGVLYISATPSSLHNATIADSITPPSIRLEKMEEGADLNLIQLWILKGNVSRDQQVVTLGKVLQSIGLLSKDVAIKDNNLSNDERLAEYEKYKQFVDTIDGVLILDPGQQLNGNVNRSKNVGEASNIRVFIKDFIGKTKIDKNKQYVIIKETASNILNDLPQRSFFETIFKNPNLLSTLSNAEDLDYSTIFTVYDRDTEAGIGANQVEQQLSVAPLKVAPDDIAILYRSCFKDMMEYDARGRMIRAFPTYQMFLIDEGRWMAWHKLWDNFYGYNAVMSIDLCRDRRIAADTAVISMTNIYDNISSHDNETSYGEWDISLGDLIWGSSGPNGTRSKTYKTIWDLPDKDILLARRDELNSIMLKPGARVHLRMGYGSNAFRLPVVFNGTLTEMNAGELTTIIAQGDGIELCNKLRVSPGDQNMDGFLKGVMEPRQFMGEMMTSRGGFLKDLANKVMGGVFYNTHPLGIVHFGVDKMPAANLLKALNFFDSFEDYGECAQNIYSSAGINTMSQWIYTEGSKKGQSLGFQWHWTDMLNPSKGDEPSIKINLFDQTPWSVFQTYAHSCADYISTVIPFEFRSTVFYGKPWWGVIDKYDYKYFYDTEHDMFIREPSGATKRALSQMRIYSSYFDILSNDIKATEEFMYTNVVGRYDEGKKSTSVMQLDSDIYPEKQKTAVVNLSVDSDVWYSNPWTQEKYAETAAASALRDYVKEMYQGELTVIGDPTVKPYDKMHMQDNHIDMSGMAEVKRVVHHFSLDTGFVTCITPDCISIIDDGQAVSIIKWLSAAATSVAAFHIGMLAKNIMWKKIYKAPLAATFREWGKKGMNKLFSEAVWNAAGVKTEDLKKLQGVSDEFVDYFRNLLSPNGKARALDTDLIKTDLGNIIKKTGLYKELDTPTMAKASEIIKKSIATINTKGGVGDVIDKFWADTKFLKKAKIMEDAGFGARFLKGLGNKTSGLAKFALKTTGNSSAAVARGTGAMVARGAAAIGTGGASLLVEVAIEIGITILTAAAIEEYGRWLRSRQALTIIPLDYRGRSFVAGINGHKGVVAGENAGAWDNFLMGSGFGGGIIKGIYGFFDVDAKDYSTTEDEAMDNYLGYKE